LVQHIRDESHRFAIAGHRAKRQKASKKSRLESIEGIGAKKRQNLLTFLGGLQEVLQADVNTLSKVPGISQVLAKKIYDALHEK
jgi:excinuclease ABC subunit C